MIRIICNGKPREAHENAVVGDVLADIGLALDSVVVECNGAILKPEEYTAHKLADGDELELIRFVGGG